MTCATNIPATSLDHARAALHTRTNTTKKTAQTHTPCGLRMARAHISVHTCSTHIHTYNTLFMQRILRLWPHMAKSNTCRWCVFVRIAFVVCVCSLARSLGPCLPPFLLPSLVTTTGASLDSRPFPHSHECELACWLVCSACWRCGGGGGAMAEPP